MRFDTKLLHGGAKRYTDGGTLPAIRQVTAFAANSAREHEEIFARQRMGYAYTRVLNPTVAEFEQRLNAVEGGADTVAFGSGMAAITAVFVALLQSGDEVIASSGIYGGSVYLLEALRPFGITVKYAPKAQAGAVEPLITDKTRIIYAELIGNPSLDVMNVKEMAQMAHSHGLPLAVDATTATPFLISPIAFGADIVVHSTSKYINGSSSAIGGTVTDAGSFQWDLGRYPGLKGYGRNGLSPFIVRVRDDCLENWGGCPSPFNAYLTMIGLETLGVRMQRICDNARFLAQALLESGKVQVNYPSLRPEYAALLQEQYRGGGGGILTLRAGSKEKAYELLDHLRYADIVSNIGDVRTLAVYPWATIFVSGTPEQKMAAGIYEDSIRVSVGLEDAQDLVEDFLRVL